MNKIKSKIKSGFTLLETLVAILLFTVALAALLALVRDSVTSATYTKNEVIATYLAQEGIDYIRNIRDEQVKVNPKTTPNPLPWDNFTFFIYTQSGCDNTNGCRLDLSNPTPLSGCLGQCVPIIVNSKSFRRTITTQKIGSVALLVKTEVVWLNGTTQRTKTLTTTLYNWSL